MDKGEVYALKYSILNRATVWFKKSMNSPMLMMSPVELAMLKLYQSEPQLILKGVCNSRINELIHNTRTKHIELLKNNITNLSDPMNLYIVAAHSTAMQAFLLANSFANAGEDSVSAIKLSLKALYFELESTHSISGFSHDEFDRYNTFILSLKKISTYDCSSWVMQDFLRVLPFMSNEVFFLKFSMRSKN